MRSGRRRIVLTAAGALGLGLMLLVVWLLLFRDSPLEVRIENRSRVALGGLALVSCSGFETRIPRLRPGDSVTVQPRFGESEDQLRMRDGRDRTYVLLGYVEGNPGGEVIVTIAGSSDRGLTGRVEDRSRYQTGYGGSARDFVLEATGQ